MRAVTLAVAVLAGCASQPPALYNTLTSEQPATGELRGQTAVGIDGATVRWRCTYAAQQGEVTVEETASHCAPYRPLP